jgi:hypothetical protein
MAMTGPYKRGSMGGNNIGGGGEAVEVYVGRFDEGITRVEKWARATQNKRGDFYPDVWVAGGEQAGAATRPAEGRNANQQKTWPGDRQGLVLLWESSFAANQVDDASGKPSRAWRLELRDKARYGRWGQVLLAGGSAAVEGADEALAAAFSKSSELTMEAVLTAPDAADAPRVILGCASGTGRNVALWQQKDKLMLGLGASNDFAGGAELATVKPGQRAHVVVACGGGTVTCYVDGVRVSVGAANCDFSKWQRLGLLIGDISGGGRNWPGSLDHLAIYSRTLGAGEARARYALLKDSLKQLGDAARAVVVARLLEQSAIPQPRGLGDYRRCLVVNVYEVLKVREGKPLSGKIAVAHWAILDLKPLESVASLKPAAEVTLTIEPFDQHPELKGERRSEDISELNLPLWFDVSDPK